jgi:tetratricopeptide (TPR) repeat protein
MGTNERLRSLIGAGEAAAHARIAKAAGTIFELTARGRSPRFGGVEIATPAAVKELDDHRPGLVAWAHEGSGDDFAWDLRHGLPKQGAPTVVHVDHEIGMATPFAKNVAGALVLLLLYELLELPGTEVRSRIEGWRRGVLGRAIDAEGAAVLARCVARAEARPTAVVLADERALLRAARSLRPARSAPFLAHLPHTWIALLDPEDRACLLEAAKDYADAIADWRELIDGEGRGQFRWHLAATLRGATDVELRLGRFAKAARAAEEAVALYEPLHEAGDARVTNGLAFVHRALAVVRAREKKHAQAHEHAARALALYEASLLDAFTMVDALDQVVLASLREVGRGGAETADHWKLAVDRTERFRAARPAHPYAPQAERVRELAQARKKRPPA